MAILLFFRFDPPKPEKLSVLSQIKQLDPVGFFFLAPSIISLILALQWGGTPEFAWSAPRIIALLVTFAVLLVIFLLVEAFMPDIAMAPVRVVLNRSITGSMVFMFLLSGSMMSIAYYISVWFQAAQGQSAVQAGIRCLPMVLGLMLTGILAAIFTQKVGYYLPMMLISPFISSIGAALLSTLQPNSGQGEWIGYQAMYGLGIGFGFQSSIMAAQTVLQRSDVPLGVSLMFFMQQMGAAIFVSVGQNIFSTRLVDRLHGSTQLDPEIILNTGATDLGRIVPPNEMPTVVEAYSYSLTRVFLLAAALSAASLLGAVAVEPRSIKSIRTLGDTEKEVESKFEEQKGLGGGMDDGGI